MEVQSIGELRERALYKLSTNWNSTIKVNLILLALGIFIEFPLNILSNRTLVEKQIISEKLYIIGIIGYFIYIFVASPIQYGIKSFYMNISRGLGGRVSDVFEGYKRFYSMVVLNFAMFFFTMLWMLLLIIPGIIKAYSYSQAWRIKKDYPNKTAIECITESRYLMDGNKFYYFLLKLSFIGWSLLSVLTLGILGFWLLPYMETTYAEFYDKLKEIKYGSNTHVEQIKEIEKEIGEELQQ